MAIIPMTICGIVLCGGKSSRMGTPKALLPFGGETMLERVVGRVLQVVDKVIVVAAADQALPDLPDQVTIARDEASEKGPLEGLRVGLTSLSDGVDAAFACSCDLPGIVPDAVRWMIEQLDEQHDIVVPYEGKFHHPLFAVYRRSVVRSIEQLIDSQRMRPIFLFDEVPTKRIHTDQLLQVDPNLASFENVNTPESYEAALKRL